MEPFYKNFFHVVTRHFTKALKLEYQPTKNVIIEICQSNDAKIKKIVNLEKS